jgi:hypothetical protein
MESNDVIRDALTSAREIAALRAFAFAVVSTTPELASKLAE